MRRRFIVLALAAAAAVAPFSGATSAVAAPPCETKCPPGPVERARCLAAHATDTQNVQRNVRNCLLYGS